MSETTMTEREIHWLEWDGDPARWGHDHWSTFAYAESCAVDYGGWLNPQRMRENLRYPTRAMDVLIVGHTDSMCLADMERAGLLGVTEGWSRPRYGLFYTEDERAAIWGKHVPTVLEPTWHVTLTDKGRDVAAWLRAHRATGGRYCDFTWTHDPATAATGASGIQAAVEGT